MPATRKELRQKIAQDLRDFLEITVVSGSTTTLSDPVELVDFDGNLVSAQVLVTAGHPDNVGRILRVIGNDRASGTITFTPELDQPLAPGDVVELVNLHGTGWRFQEYHRVIAAVIRDYSGYLPIETSSNATTFDADDPVLAIPDDWIGVYGVSVVDTEQVVWDLKPARYTNTPGWFLHRETRTVRIQGDAYLDRFQGAEMTLLGYARHPEVTADDDVCHIDLEWVRHKCKADLLALRGRETDQWSVEWQRMAAGRGPALLMSWQANTQLLEELA